jgi:thiamine-phosphate pyrophosphorylase
VFTRPVSILFSKAHVVQPGANTSKPCPSLELYVIVDEGLLVAGALPVVLEEVIRGGADAVQFRAKNLSKRQYYERASSLIPLVRQKGIPFFVNDHLDVALALSADGIHLGQNDLPCVAARNIVPRHMILGISTHSVEQAERAVENGAGYVAIGSIFPTTTKEKPEAIVGTEMVTRVKELAGTVPVVAIGGIGVHNVAEVVRSGADGVAVASAVVLAADPCAAARELKEKIRAARGI